MSAEVYSLGDLPKGERCHHMPESFYEEGDRLIAAERRAYAKALATPDKRNCDAWARASKRLTAHENSHCTD